MRDQWKLEMNKQCAINEIRMTEQRFDQWNLPMTKNARSMKLEWINNARWMEIKNDMNNARNQWKLEWLNNAWSIEIRIRLNNARSMKVRMTKQCVMNGN